MGLKKFIKKITRPISKVLDKIVPNEIKPILPYAAAFAPYLLPAGGTGILGSMAGRAMVTGGLNIGSQLAQEGSEGDFSGLSAILAALQGAATAQGAGSTLRGMKNPGEAVGIAGGNMPGQGIGGFKYDASGLGALDKAKNFGLEIAAKGADTLGGFANTLQNNPFSMASLKAASVPASLATGDLAMAQARAAMKDWEEGEALRMAAEGADNEAYDAARRSAVIASLQAYGYVEDQINDTLSQLGMQLLAKGGRVGFAHGGSGFDGIINAIVKTDENDMKMANLIPEELKIGLAEEFEIIFKRPPANDEELFRYYYDKEEWKGPGDNVQMIEGESEEVMAADGGMMSVLPPGMEMDYRGGGMIPMGTRERADDVPARVSKNEFVMTADAVRAAGGGSVNKGAERMYNLMHNLEARA
tara:strand:+ start:5078 stop:6325 length:1248 start_codon:yes stop_codon:yes gene_type:complete